MSDKTIPEGALNTALQPVADTPPPPRAAAVTSPFLTTLRKFVGDSLMPVP